MGHISRWLPRKRVRERSGGFRPVFGEQVGGFAAFVHRGFLTGLTGMFCIAEPFDLQALAQGFAGAVHDGVVVGRADAALLADFVGREAEDFFMVNTRAVFSGIW